jgi:acetoin utilization deacetylase AcuC-like enzyme
MTMEAVRHKARSCATTGIVKDPRYAGHCMGPGEPECPERLAVLYAMLQELEESGCFQEIAPRKADREELQRVHAPDYIGHIAATAGKEMTYLDPDTRASALSHDTALLAAGGLCRAIEEVNAGRVDNAFALIRPPGHHAERAASKGFCLYNNVAVGAHFGRSSLGLERILIVDWDLHHGNGTQHCFEDSPAVLFFSTHRAFTFPHSGRLREIGRDRGRGYTINVPLLPGLGDGDFVAIFEKILKPVAMEFKPDFILVSAGFDLHFNDPLGGMRVTPEGFAALTRSLLDVAAACCEGKIVMALEGGYDLEGLRDSVREVLREMAGLRKSDVAGTMATAQREKIAEVIWRVRRRHRRFWKSLDAPPFDGPRDVPSTGERIRGTLSRVVAYFKS